MIFECVGCETQVNGTVVATHENYQGEELPSKVTLVACPVCNNPSLMLQEIWEAFSPTGEHITDWDEPVRIWPNADITDWRLPVSVRVSLEEANKCYKAKAFNACAVMCGRTLEVICREVGIKTNILAGGLKQLLEKEVIDKKIYVWGEALRKKRNIGAHAAEENISKSDASDVLDFTKAICQNIFVLDKQFENFMKRQKAVDV